MISRIRNNKFSILILIALLTAGLFFYLRTTHVPENETKIIKPSQLDFSQSNQLRENTVEAVSKSSDNSVAAPQVSEPAALSEKEKSAWKALHEILKSKNDNDPRLDTELRTMSETFHKALYEEYRAMKPEARNERGTLVFLIARDLKTPADVEFLQSVYQESPCLNMGDCSAGPDADPQDTGAQQTSLNYPQVAGLYQLDRQLSQRPELLRDPAFRSGIYNLLKFAENFPVPQVHQKAQQIREKYGL
jgi:hypothetical protein